MTRSRPDDPRPLSGAALADCVIQRFPLPIARPFRRFVEARQADSRGI